MSSQSPFFRIPNDPRNNPDAFVNLATNYFHMAKAITILKEELQPHDLTHPQLGDLQLLSDSINSKWPQKHVRDMGLNPLARYIESHLKNCEAYSLTT